MQTPDRLLCCLSCLQPRGREEQMRASMPQTMFIPKDFTKRPRLFHYETTVLSGPTNSSKIVTYFPNHVTKSPEIKTFSECAKGAEKASCGGTDSPKPPFWTTVSPHDAFSAPLAHSQFYS